MENNNSCDNILSIGSASSKSVDASEDIQNLELELERLKMKIVDRERHISYLEDLVKEQQYWIHTLCKKEITDQSSEICIVTDKDIERELSVREKIMAINNNCSLQTYSLNVYETVEVIGCSGGRAKQIVKKKTEP